LPFLPICLIVLIGGNIEMDRYELRLLLGSRVEAIMLRNNLSQRALSRMADVSYTTIHEICHGRKNATLFTVIAVAGALGTTVDGLLRGERAGNE